MKLVELAGVSDPVCSAALEEACVRLFSPETELLLLYVNAPAVVIGRHQVPPAETDLSFLARRRIRLVRRLTGGGAVYHDPGNLNFAFVSGFDRSRFLRYERWLAPVVDALCGLGLPARFRAPNAICVEGRKISGNAQFTDTRRMLSHGTLLFSTDLGDLARALTPDGSVVESRGVPSAPSPVANLQPYLTDTADMDAFRVRFRSMLAERLGGLEPIRFSEDQNEQLDRLRRRYGSWQWTWGRSPMFCAEQPATGAEGCSRVRLTVDGGIVRRAVCVDADATPVPAMEMRRYDELGFGQPPPS